MPRSPECGGLVQSSLVLRTPAPSVQLEAVRTVVSLCVEYVHKQGYPQCGGLVSNHLLARTLVPTGGGR